MSTLSIHHEFETAVPSARALSPAAEMIRKSSDPVEFLELAFTPIDMETALDAVIRRAPSARFTYVVTPNVDHVVRLQLQRSDLWPAYRGAWMTLCDSRILSRLARTVGRDLPVVTGSDLTAALFERIAPDDPVAILGGSSAKIDEIAKRFGLRNVRHYNPPMGFIHNPRELARAVRFVVEAKARYSFLAVGSPQQEIVARRVAKACGARGVGFCIGASLDFLTGEEQRAPVVMQQMALEWLYRLCANPQRLWRRYLIEGPQIFSIHQTWCRRASPMERAAGGRSR
ncbi:exopolysaccharide biosynthesis WecB/TagA/CpsF family protein [Novosphingobium sp. PhB165]|uniref:WecB/TagA/CpsF family glycosyltransferase n=1 Tax=Novosphingobium sp. PhB165 TaxID=2485105 RepID=UPI0010494445|nr:WecB/TagA/CpsF family glycosyltransferase [Novosphingobium sp. PhB165]TCM20823.1 exopolysaccharide biosynthesis WecB/TagA/CpsF family protein [Novosphingobium sp. PhB165]